MEIFMLISMLFCHIIDDYCLQGILASMKQKSWWVKNNPEEKYNKDYIMALFMHSASWSFMILLPVSISAYINLYADEFWITLSMLWIINLIIHMFVDDLKANRNKINLITDQLIHIIQIIFTFILLNN